MEAFLSCYTRCIQPKSTWELNTKLNRFRSLCSLLTSSARIYATPLRCVGHIHSFTSSPSPSSTHDLRPAHAYNQFTGRISQDNQTISSKLHAKQHGL
jgi:hypothetical protein